MSLDTVVPAEAGSRSSPAATAERRMPACAGLAMRGCRSFAAMLLGVVLFALLGTGPAHAVRPDEMLRDPVLEGRAREVSREFGALCIDLQNAPELLDLRQTLSMDMIHPNMLGYQRIAQLAVAQVMEAGLRRM